jgi:molybdate transport system ATP-binding protein
MAAPALHVDVAVPRRDFAVRVRLTVGREAVALVGPSGSGKSTVLRAVAGLERLREGRVALGDRVWADPARRVHVPPDRRSVGMVFQDHALFPHLTVAGNVAFAGRDRVGELLARMGVDHLADARPHELSGGERQRVALARALARDPEVLLLDEPMSALDAHTRAGVRGELRGALRGLGLPTLVVSHDFADAAALADRVVVLDRGRVVQAGTPAEVVARPVNGFVAALAGTNLLTGTATAGPVGSTVVLDDGGVVTSADAADGRVGVVVHPRRVTPVERVPPGANALAGTVRELVDLGHALRMRVGPLVVEVDAPWTGVALAEGAPVLAAFRPRDTRLVGPGPAPAELSAEDAGT